MRKLLTILNAIARDQQPWKHACIQSLSRSRGRRSDTRSGGEGTLWLCGTRLDAEGNRAGAIVTWRQGLAIMQRLGTLAPDHAAFRRDRDWFEARLAELGD
jgi:hypothetical protein